MKNPKIYLEHANITTNNLDETVEFLKIAFPSFYIRHQAGEGTEKWAHFGDEHSYLAINQGAIPTKVENNYSTNGIKHLGFVVENLEKLGKKLEEAGYERSYAIMEHKHRRREYFFDKAGLDYEFIEYFSEKNEERNDYSDT